jgi:hypothetical protein
MGFNGGIVKSTCRIRNSEQRAFRRSIERIIIKSVEDFFRTAAFVKITLSGLKYLRKVLFICVSQAALTCRIKMRFIFLAPHANLRFVERCAMPRDQLPPHALFFRWGKFQVGAFGRPAILALTFFAVLVACFWVR